MTDTAGGSADRPSVEPSPVPGQRVPANAPAAKAFVSHEQSIKDAFGGRSGMLDTGLPAVVFVIAYTASSQDMRLAIISALAVGVVLALIKLVQRRPVQHAVAGLAGVIVSAYIASKTGEARNFFVPGLFINAGYALAYAVSALVRWPLIGVVVAAVSQQGMGWRKDPILLGAYTRATWLWVAMFAVRLAVQFPLWLAKSLGALAIARVAMGWPIFLLTVWLTFLIVRNATAATPADGEEPAAA